MQQIKQHPKHDALAGRVCELLGHETGNGDSCRLMGLVQQLATWTHSLHLMLGVSKRWGYREKPLQSFKACKKC